MSTPLHVAFEGPRVSEAGLSVEDLQKTLEHVQRAVRLMVGHLIGADPSPRGRPLKFVRDQSALRLVRTAPGSLVAELALSPPLGDQLLWDYGLSGREPPSEVERRSKTRRCRKESSRS